MSRRKDFQVKTASFEKAKLFFSALFNALAQATVKYNNSSTFTVHLIDNLSSLLGESFDQQRHEHNQSYVEHFGVVGSSVEGVALQAGLQIVQYRVAGLFRFASSALGVPQIPDCVDALSRNGGCAAEKIDVTVVAVFGREAGVAAEDSAPSAKPFFDPAEKLTKK